MGRIYRAGLRFSALATVRVKKLYAYIAALCCIMAMLVAPAQASAHHWYIAKGTRCIARPTTTGYLIAARTSFLLGVHPDKKNNMQNIELKARLVPTTAGLNYPRSWGVDKKYVPLRYEDRAIRSRFQVTTDWVSASYDWDLEVKMKWDRRGKLDWHEHLTVHFRESFCNTGGGF